MAEETRFTWSPATDGRYWASFGNHSHIQPPTTDEKQGVDNLNKISEAIERNVNQMGRMAVAPPPPFIPPIREQEAHSRNVRRGGGKQNKNSR